jgi:hypothetical protein
LWSAEQIVGSVQMTRHVIPATIASTRFLPSSIGTSIRVRRLFARIRWVIPMSRIDNCFVTASISGAVKWWVMKHEISWNAGMRHWTCNKCGRTSDQASVFDAQRELDIKDCTSIPKPAPGTETMRLMRALKKERSGVRFSVQPAEGKPFIELNLFHDTVPSLKFLSIQFEMLAGVTSEQARVLVEAMNERIVGIVVTPK